MTNSTEPCPSCDRDLSYPGAPGHECYTYAEQRENIARVDTYAVAMFGEPVTGRDRVYAVKAVAQANRELAVLRAKVAHVEALIDDWQSFHVEAARNLDDLCAVLADPAPAEVTR